MGAEAAGEGGALDEPFEGAGKGHEAAGNEVGDEPAAAAVEDGGAGGGEAVLDFAQRQKALATGILGRAFHEQGPVRVEGIVVPDDDFSAGSGDAHHFSQGGGDEWRLGEMVQYGDGEYHVEGCVRKWEFVGGAGDDVAALLAGEDGAHSGGWFDAGEAAVGAEGGEESAGAAADVEGVAAVDEGADEGDAFAEIMVGDVGR